MPLMATHLTLSLKKAADPSNSTSSAHEMDSISFARWTISGAERGDGDAGPSSRGKDQDV